MSDLRNLLTNEISTVFISVKTAYKIKTEEISNKCTTVGISLTLPSITGTTRWLELFLLVNNF
jgi:hypothetical protein